MGHPVVHFEIVGRAPEALRRYYGALFGWTFDTSNPVSKAVSEALNYGFTEPGKGGGGIPGGIGGGTGYEPHVIFYVGVEDVEAMLAKAESLGGKRRMGPEKSPSGQLVIGQFGDPEGNVVGVASAGVGASPVQ